MENQDDKLQKIQFRRFEKGDDWNQLNGLLRASYKSLADAGMRYAASHEDVEATQRNSAGGECYIGCLDQKIICCALLRLPHLQLKSTGADLRPAWYRQAEVAVFAKFAVHPNLQGSGLGTRLLKFIEERARDLAFKEIALDTSESATHLISMYKKRGYRFIEFHQWPTTNYRSLVFSKAL